MKRKCCPPSSSSSLCSSSSSSPSSSSSSSTTSSCIASSPVNKDDDKNNDQHLQPKKHAIQSKNKNNKNKPNNKRVRTTKKSTANADHNSAAAAAAATSQKSRSSIYRGVTRHRWTGRFEAHLWDKTTWNSIQNKRGRQIYLGAYDNEEDAARTYDLAALKYWGPSSILNFPVETYTKEVEEMQKLTKEEFLASLRRRSSGFSRGVSKYRGVARHHHNGRWEARIGRVCGNKYLYLGTYSTQEEAAAAYDLAAIEFRGPNAVTNFDISYYANKLNKITSTGDEEVHVKEEEINPELHNEKVQADKVNDQDYQQEEEKNQVVQPSSTPTSEESADANGPIDKVQEEEEAYIDHKEEEKNQVVVQPSISIPKFETIDSQDIVSVMDPTEEHEHPWDLCLDIGFHSLQIPDILLEEKSPAEVLGLLDDKEFEDNIEFIFDGHDEFSERDFLQDAISGTDRYKTNEEVLVKGNDAPASPASSPLSSTTSVCSNV